MKKRLDWDEWYPVYEFNETGRAEIEVSKEFVARVEAAFKEFDAVQDELRRLSGRDGACSDGC